MVERASYTRVVPGSRPGSPTSILDMKKNIFNLLGFIGAFLIISAYFFLSFNIVDSQDLIYSALNLVGALGIVLSSLEKKDFPPILLNIFWMGIALISILRLL